MPNHQRSGTVLGQVYHMSGLIKSNLNAQLGMKF